MIDDRLDKQFKQKLEDHRTDFDDVYWQEMQTLMRIRQNPFKMLWSYVLNRYIWVPLSAILITATAWVLFNNVSNVHATTGNNNALSSVKQQHITSGNIQVPAKGNSKLTNNADDKISNAYKTTTKGAIGTIEKNNNPAYKQSEQEKGIHKLINGNSTRKSYNNTIITASAISATQTAREPSTAKNVNTNRGNSNQNISLTNNNNNGHSAAIQKTEQASDKNMMATTGVDIHSEAANHTNNITKTATVNNAAIQSDPTAEPLMSMNKLIIKDSFSSLPAYLAYTNMYITKTTPFSVLTYRTGAKPIHHSRFELQASAGLKWIQPGSGYDAVKAQNGSISIIAPFRNVLIGVGMGYSTFSLNKKVTFDSTSLLTFHIVKPKDSVYVIRVVVDTIRHKAYILFGDKVKHISYDSARQLKYTIALNYKNAQRFVDIPLFIGHRFRIVHGLSTDIQGGIAYLFNSSAPFTYRDNEGTYYRVPAYNAYSVFGRASLNYAFTRRWGVLAYYQYAYARTFTKSPFGYLDWTSNGAGIGTFYRF